MLQTYSILVSGKVQGVFYRRFTREKAIELGLDGIVENQPDGSVLILATGTNSQITQLISWCRQGPRRAIVSSVDAEIIETRTFKGFSIQ